MAAAIILSLSRDREAHIGLTGGRGGAAVLRALAVGDGIDWGRVHCWWSDERFLPLGDPGRNDVQARAALLDRVDVPTGNVHPMPSPDTASSPGEGAATYRAELGAFGGPPLCVAVLSMGEDGHVASLFPGHAALREESPVVAVTGSPKPPPVRITMTLPAINRAQEVLLLATGPDKADAVGLYLAAPGPTAVPATGVRGVRSTSLVLDEAAAARVPTSLRGR
jgi:6-phosphogluconolactonase